MKDGVARRREQMVLEIPVMVLIFLAIAPLVLMTPLRLSVECSCARLSEEAEMMAAMTEEEDEVRHCR